MKVPGKTSLRGAEGEKKICDDISSGGEKKKIWELSGGMFYKNLLKANTGDMSSF